MNVMQITVYDKTYTIPSQCESTEDECECVRTLIKLEWASLEDIVGIKHYFTSGALRSAIYRFEII